MHSAHASVVDGTEGRALWFLGNLATIKIPAAQTAGRYSLFDVLLCKHAAPPVHSHPEDETFIVLDGTISFWLDGRRHRCTNGSIVYAPGGAPHTFLVESDTAHVLTLSTPAGIERLVELLGVPATELRLPDDDIFPTRAAIDAAQAACGIKVLGPPPQPDT